MSKGQIVQRPWCPFCGQKVGKASDAIQRKMQEFPVGHCQCGAVYSCDATGHNVGAAMVETLVFACQDNWDMAWELMPEDDYLTGRIENYDEITHQVVDVGNIDGRPARGVLYFVRLHTEISELAKRISEKKKESAPQAEIEEVRSSVEVEPSPEPNRPKKKANKRQVKALANEGDIDELVALCLDDKKTLRLLQRLLYEPFEEKRWYYAWLLGQVCARVSTRDPGQVSQLLHRLFEACSDSAATNWGMVETIGNVVAARPDIFGAFTRHLLGYMGDSSTQVQVIWALAEIARTRPDLVRDTPFYSMFHFLNHPEGDVRGHTARLMGRLKASEVSMQLMALSGDNHELQIWEGEGFKNTTVSQEAAQALAAITGGKKDE